MKSSDDILVWAWWALFKFQICFRSCFVLNVLLKYSAEYVYTQAVRHRSNVSIYLKQKLEYKKNETISHHELDIIHIILRSSRRYWDKIGRWHCILFVLKTLIFVTLYFNTDMIQIIIIITFEFMLCLNKYLVSILLPNILVWFVGNVFCHQHKCINLQKVSKSKLF